MGPIPMANSPYTSRRVPSKALMIMLVGWIRVSTFKISIVDIGQTFRVDPLSISTLEMIISLHFTIMCMGKVCFLPSGGSSSFIKEIWLMANTIKTIPSKEDSVTPVGTHVSLFAPVWLSFFLCSLYGLLISFISFFTCLLPCFFCFSTYTHGAWSLGARVRPSRRKQKGQICNQEDASPQRAMLSRLRGLAPSRVVFSSPLSL